MVDYARTARRVREPTSGITPSLFFIVFSIVLTVTLGVALSLLLAAFSKRQTFVACGVGAVVVVVVLRQH